MRSNGQGLDLSTIRLKTVDLGSGYTVTDKNIEYYNENAESFFNGTVNADMSLWRDKFESYVANGGRVLDAGCGSGRDSKAFKQHGFSVVAFDEEFDGIWACVSLLHVPEEDLQGVLGKLHKALKKNGKLYVAFKYGEGMTKRGERMFCDFTEKSLPKVLTDAGFSVLEIGITSDIRPGRGEEKWVNAIAALLQ